MPFIPASKLREIFTDFLKIDTKNLTKEQIQSIDNSILQSAANLQALREMPKDFQDEYIARNFGDLAQVTQAQTSPNNPAQPKTQPPKPLKSSADSSNIEDSLLFKAIYYPLMCIVLIALVMGFFALKTQGFKYVNQTAQTEPLIR